MPRIGKVSFPPVEGNCSSDLTKLVNKVLKNDSIKRDCTLFPENCENSLSAFSIHSTRLRKRSKSEPAETA